MVEAVLKLRPAIYGDGFAGGRGDAVDEFGGVCGGGAGHLSDFSKGAEEGWRAGASGDRCGASLRAFWRAREVEGHSDGLDSSSLKSRAERGGRLRLGGRGRPRPCGSTARRFPPMKIRLTTVTIALAAVPAFPQSARTGVSNPDPVNITAQTDESSGVKATKPSAAIPATPESSTGRRPLTSHEAARGSGEVYGAYVPYSGAAAPSAADRAVISDPDAAIVTSVEEHAGEVREGTLLRARMKQGLSTVTTVAGSNFTAELTEPVLKDGRVILPLGALIGGRVTEVHGGRRISGAAMLHLEARTVTLPDGSRYLIHAQLIDTDQSSRTKVDGEGTLIRRDHPKETLAAMGVATGGAAAAGAMIGGGVGAAVGAGIGAGAGAVVWLKQDRQASLPQDSMLVFSLTEAMPVMPVGGSPVGRVERMKAVGRGESVKAGGIVE